MSGSHYEAVIRGWSPDMVRVYPEDRLHFLPETGSTNDDLLDLIRKGKAEHLTTVWADHQRKGRGRRGDKWEALSATNLLVSVALRLPEDRATWTRLPHLAARVLGEAIESILPEEKTVQAKWPNDLYLEGKKTAGILVETVLSEPPFAVVGIGLNVNERREAFPPELQETATSLYEVLGCESSRSFLLGLLIQGFVSLFPSGLESFEPVRQWLRSRDFLEGKRIRVIAANEEVEGLARGLGADGELLVDIESGETRAIISSEKIELC